MQRPAPPSVAFQLPENESPLYTKAGSASLCAMVGSADMLKGPHPPCAHWAEVWSE